MRSGFGRALPRECCGLLVGRAEGRRIEVSLAYEALNAEPRRPRSRFAIGPRDLLAADDVARALGLEIVGTWHGHPDGPLAPSRRDVEEADGSWVHVVLAPESGGVGAVAWRPACGRAEPVALEVAGANDRPGA